MLILILAYLGGVLTIASPCILPVLPFVFARSDQSFARTGLPLLAGMALTFTLVATLAAVGGGWVVQANEYGRWLALVLMAVFGITLLFPRIGERLMHPLVSAGNRMTNALTVGKKPQMGTSFLLGIATGLLWAPCAGPILGLVLTGAALQGANVGSTLLLLAYAAGAVTSLTLALLIGGKVFSAMKRSLGAGEWIRRGLGVAMLGGVAAIASGLDTGLLTRVSTVATAGLEQKLIDKLSPREPQGGAMMAGGAMMSRTAMTGKSPAMMAMHGAASNDDTLPVEGKLPPLTGAVDWLNSAPLTAAQLKGKVVLVDFYL